MPEPIEGGRVDGEQVVEAVYASFDDEVIRGAGLLVEGEPHQGKPEKKGVSRRLPGAERRGRQGWREDGRSAAVDDAAAARREERASAAQQAERGVGLDVVPGARRCARPAPAEAHASRPGSSLSDAHRSVGKSHLSAVRIGPTRVTTIPDLSGDAKIAPCACCC